MTDLLEHPQVREALARYRAALREGVEEGEASALVAAVVSAYQASLVAQTDAETMEQAAQALGRFEDHLNYLSPNRPGGWSGWLADLLEAAAPLLVAKERAKLAEAEKDRTIAWARHDNAVKQLASVRRETLEEAAKALEGMDFNDQRIDRLEAENCAEFVRQLAASKEAK